MGAFEIVIGAILILIAAVLSFAILMQEGKGGMGALTGEASGNSNFGRNAGKTLGATLKTITKYGVIALMVLIIAVNVVAVYL